MASSVEDMGEVGAAAATATNEQHDQPEQPEIVKANGGELNGTVADVVPAKTVEEEDVSTKVAATDDPAPKVSESEADENSQTSRPVSSNGPTEDETSQDDGGEETEESRPAPGSENQVPSSSSALFYNLIINQMYNRC